MSEDHAERKATPEKPVDRWEKVKANIEKEKELLNTKMNASATQFRNSRVMSCSKVLLRNGRAVCVAFPTNPKPQDLAASKSSETTSWN